MGREAECICEWGTDSATVRALLETDELILREGIRRKLRFSEMERVRTEEDKLAFRFKGEDVALVLGDAIAAKWLQIISSPPVALAKKLGITPESVVWTLGEINDVELEGALSAAKGLRSSGADLIVGCVDSMEGLADVLKKTASLVRKGLPLWIIYPKGKGQMVSESAIRSEARATGLIDLKIASISSVHTGLRFAMRK